MPNDQEHIINIIARMKDSASKPIAELGKNIDKFNFARQESVRLSREEQKALNDHESAIKDLNTVINVHIGQLNKLHNDRKKQQAEMRKIRKDEALDEKTRAELLSKTSAKIKNLNDQEILYNKRLAAAKHNKIALEKDEISGIQRLGVAIGRAERTVRKAIVTDEEWVEVTKRARKENISLRRAIKDTDSRFELFGRRLRVTGDNLGRMERRLALMGRAMLGIAVASVIIFMQSFVSSLVAVGGQLIALAGSLTFAAGTLVGTFIPAIAQAIPVLGLLAGALSRVSAIQEAIQQQEAVRQQGAGARADDAEQERQGAESIADAKRAVTEAEQDLTEARAEAKFELRELVLAERAAELALTDSQRSLRDAIEEGDVGEISSLQLGQDSARLDLTQARRARRQGPSGVTDATKALADANRNLARTQEDVAQSTQQQSAAQENLAFSLSELTETEREFMRHIIDFKERVKEEFTPITDIIISSFDQGLTNVERLLFDNRIIDGATKLARTLGNEIQRFTGLLTNERSTSFWTDVLGEGRKNLEPIFDIFSNLWRIFRDITESAAPVLRDLFGDIADKTKEWSSSLRDGGGATSFFEEGLVHLRRWGTLLEEVVGLWFDLMGVSGDSALNTLDDFTDRIRDARQALSENPEEATKFFDETSEALGYLLDILVNIGRTLVNIFSEHGVDTVRAFATIIDTILLPAFEFATIATGSFIRGIEFLLGLFDGFIGKVVQTSVAIGLTYLQFKLIYNIITIMLGPLKALFLLFAGGAFGAAARGAGALASSFNAIKAAFIAGGVVSGFQSLGALVSGLTTRFKQLGIAMKLVTVGSVIGIVLSGLAVLGQALGVFGDNEEAAALDVDKLTDSIYAQIDAIRELRDQKVSESEANVSARRARIAERDALEDLQKLRRKDGVSQRRLTEARLTYVEAQNATIRAERRLKDVVNDRGRVENKVQRATEEAVTNSVTNITAYNEAIGETNDKIDAFQEQLGKTKDEESRETLTRHLIDAYKDLNTLTAGLREEQDKLNNTADRATDATRKWGKQTDDLTDAQEDNRKGTKKTRSAWGTLIDTIWGGGKQSAETGRTIVDVSDKILSEFGAKKLNVKVPDAKKVYKPASLGTGFATGGYFGSPKERRPDDRLIAVGGGEAILTGHHQQAVNMGLAFGKAAGVVPYGSLGEMFHRDRREHKTAGYAKGGVVPQGGFPDAMGALPGLDALAWFLEKKFGLHVISGSRPGAVTTSGNPSDHGWGGAIDVSNGYTTPQMDAANAYLRKSIGGGGGFDPVYSGGIIKQMLYRTMIGGDHFNHIHVALEEAVARNASAVISALTGGKISGVGAGQIPRIKIGGDKGPLRDMIQGQADALRKAGNKYINKKTMTLDLAPGPGAHQGVLSEAEVRRIFLQAFRITGVSPGGGNLADLMNLAFEESSWNPGAENKTSAGLAAGLPQGILQVVGDTFNAYKMKKYPDPFNPLHNAIASIRYQMARYGDIQRHAPYARGGIVPAFDNGGVVPGPLGHPRAVIAHGGETFYPTHKANYQTGGIVKDIRSDLRDIRSGRKDLKSSRLKKGLEAIEELLRDGGSFDDLVAAVELLGTSLTRKMNEWAYRVRKGFVGQIRSHVQIADRQLNILERQGKFLGKELDEIDKLIKVTRRKLKKADDRDDKQKLRAALNNLQKRQEEVGSAFSDNLIARLDAQVAVFDAAIGRFQQRLGINDTMQAILQAKNRLAGRPENEGLQALLQQRGNVLGKEQDRIQKELRKARRAGDDERVRELQQALLDNKLALLENTEAMRETSGTLNEIFGFNSSAWQMFRQAVFTGTGGLLPSYNMPNVPGQPLNSTLGGNNGNININITEPMEVADPVALSTRIAFEMKKYKV